MVCTQYRSNFLYHFTILSALFTSTIACDEQPDLSLANQGSLALPLTFTTPDNQIHRLVGGALMIEGPQTMTIALDDYAEEKDLLLLLDPGTYTVALEGNWSLERQNEEGIFEPVDAVLLSPNPQSQTVGANSKIQLELLFGYSDAKISMGGPETVDDKGQMEIDIAVENWECTPGDKLLSPCDEIPGSYQESICENGFWAPWSACTDQDDAMEELESGSLLYGIEILDKSLWTIDTDSGDAHFVLEFDEDMVALAKDPNSDLIFAVASPLGKTSTLLSLNPATGLTTTIGDIGFDSVKGLAFGPKGSALFAITYLNELLSIDPTTGAGQLIGAPGTTHLDSLAYHQDRGVLYATNIDNDSLYEIDPITGTAKVVGEVGFGNVSGLAYDQTSGLLYGLARAEGSLITINPDTGTGSYRAPLFNSAFNGATF